MKKIKGLLARFLQWIQSAHTAYRSNEYPPIDTDNVIEFDFRTRRRINNENEEEILDEEPLRIELFLKPNVVRRMKEMQKLNGATSHIDIIRRALSFYDTALTVTHEEGSKIFVYRGDEKPEQLNIY